MATGRVGSLFLTTVLLEDKRLAAPLRAYPIELLLLGDEVHLGWWVLSLGNRVANLLLLLSCETRRGH